MDKKVMRRVGAVLLAVALVGVGAGYGGYRIAASWQHDRDDEAVVHWVRDRQPLLNEVLMAWQMAQQRAAAQQQPQAQPQAAPEQSQAPAQSPAKPGGGK